jgi:carbonic anhydrase
MPTQTAESQSKITPEQALLFLKEGNDRFKNGQLRKREYAFQIQETAAGQFPFACIVSCIDSRVPISLIFDQGIGSIKSAKVAGNIINEDILGSLEFACNYAGAKVVVVLGHTSCGAIMGACDKVELGNLTSLLSKINPALLGTAEPKDPEKRTSKNLDFVNAVARKNVTVMVEQVRTYSNVLRSLEENEKIKIIGAMYDISTGAVEYLNETMN